MEKPYIPNRDDNNDTSPDVKLILGSTRHTRPMIMINGYGKNILNKKNGHKASIAWVLQKTYPYPVHKTPWT